MVRKIYKLALQYIWVNIRLCQNLMCIWVQKMLWGIEIYKIDLIYVKLYERSIQLWTMYDHTLLKLSNFLYKSYGQKYVTTPIFKVFGPYLDIIIIIMW
jgi:hypothetical protein